MTPDFYPRSPTLITLDVIGEVISTGEAKDGDFVILFLAIGAYTPNRSGELKRDTTRLRKNC